MRPSTDAKSRVDHSAGAITTTTAEINAYYYFTILLIVGYPAI
jgi:hypothetical protein